MILVNRIRKINHWTDWDLLPAVGNSKKKKNRKKKENQRQHVDYRLEIFATLIHEGNWAAKASGTVIRDGETDWLIAVQHDPRSNCGTRFGSSSLLDLAYKVSNPQHVIDL